MPSKEFRRSAAALAFVIGTEAFSPSGAFAQQKKVPLPEMTSSQSVQLVREKKPVPVSQEHLKTIVACALTEKAGKTITKAEDPQSSKPLREIVLMDKKNDVTYTVKITKPYPRTFDRLKAYEERGDMPFIEISENPLKNTKLSEEILSKDPFFNAQMRTVITPTIITGGVKSNIIPSDASATFNVRIHTGDNIESVLDHVKKVINDSRIDIKTEADFAGFNPSILPETKHPSFDILKKVVKDVFGRDTAVIPFLTFATTDSKYFQNIGYGDAVYRLNAVDMNKSESQSIHGYDERIPIDSYERYIKFMITFMKESNNLLQ